MLEKRKQILNQKSNSLIYSIVIVIVYIVFNQ